MRSRQRCGRGARAASERPRTARRRRISRRWRSSRCRAAPNRRTHRRDRRLSAPPQRASAISINGTAIQANATVDGNEERAVPPARRRRRARAAIGGRFAAKPEPAAREREGRDDRDRADHSARIVAGDVVERCVRHQIVGHDIDDVVRQHGGRGSRRNQQRRQRTGKRAHAALFGPPRCRASSQGAAWPSTARPSGRARRRARVYE